MMEGLTRRSPVFVDEIDEDEIRSVPDVNEEQFGAHTGRDHSNFVAFHTSMSILALSDPPKRVHHGVLLS